MLKKLNRVNYLLDIYGSLLTSRQKNALQLYFINDLTLSEIALKFRISRQAVYDLIRRAVGALERLEERLSIYSQFKHLRQHLGEAERILNGKSLGTEEQEYLKEIVQELLDYNEQ
ncbi:MAG: hypothetical protein GX973_04280 [Firmicutes bacterium]|nr:hypothetical protein [Bacillota bacterium]